MSRHATTYLVSATAAPNRYGAIPLLGTLPTTRASSSERFAFASGPGQLGSQGWH
jgi:hypothetical protein